MDDLIHETDNAIEQILSDFDTQAIGNKIYDGHQSATSNVATRATQLRNEILEALEPVQVTPTEADIFHHWNRQRQHLTASRRRVLSKDALVEDHAANPQLPKAINREGFTDPGAKAVPGEARENEEERRDSALALEWDASQEWCATDANLEDVLERKDAIVTLLTKAQKSGKHTTFTPERFNDGLQFTLRVYGKEDKLPYSDLWVPDPRLRYQNDETIGEFDESRVVRVFFAESIEKEASPTRGRSRYQKRFMEKEMTYKEQADRPSFIAAGKYYACTHKLSPPTMVHPALRQRESPKQECNEEEPLQHVSWQPPPGKRYLPLKQFRPSPNLRPTKQSTFRPGLPAILERAETAFFPFKKARASPKAQHPEQGFLVPGRPAILHRTETTPVSSAHQMLRNMLQPAPKEPGSKKQNRDIDLKPVVDSMKAVSSFSIKDVVLPKMGGREDESSLKNGRIMRQRFDVKSQVAEHYFPWHTLENAVEVYELEEN